MSKAEPYDITLEDRTDYFYAHVIVHQIDEKMYSTCVTLLVNACRKAGRDRLLIERDVQGVVPKAVVLLQVRFLQEVSQGLTVAIVDANPGNVAELERNLSLIPNEGNVRIFSSLDKAETWLGVAVSREARP